MKTERKKTTKLLTLTFGYHQHNDEAHHADREECRVIKASAEALKLAVHEEVVEGWYFGTVNCCADHMMELVLKLTALDLAKQTSLEIRDDATSRRFSKVAGLGEVVFTHQGKTWIGTGQPKGFRPRISRAA